MLQMERNNYCTKKTLATSIHILQTKTWLPERAWTRSTNMKKLCYPHVIFVVLYLYLLSMCCIHKAHLRTKANFCLKFSLFIMFHEPTSTNLIKNAFTIKLSFTCLMIQCLELRVAIFSNDLIGGFKFSIAFLPQWC